jgi:hypothetical protein
MSFQAYLDNVEDKTGLTPREFIALAHERGFDQPSTKAGTIVECLSGTMTWDAGTRWPLYTSSRTARRSTRSTSERPARTATIPTCSGWMASGTDLDPSHDR